MRSNRTQKTYTLADIVLPLLAAIFFSAFIYLDALNIDSTPLYTLLALSAYAMLLIMRPLHLLICGFFIGYLWFFWIGFSFHYYNLDFMVSVVIFFFGIIYALFFGIAALFKTIWLRAAALFLLSFFEPFDFNWLQIELPLVLTYFGIAKWQFALLLFGLAALIALKHSWKLLGIIFLLCAIDYAPKHAIEPDLKIKLIQTSLPQRLKWKESSMPTTLKRNFSYIDEAIKEHYDVIILPESAFPMFLNNHPYLEERLLEKSEQITIITGALFDEHFQNYNVTYIFENGTMQVIKKMVLVPFGEYIPLPDFIGDWVNEMVFGGASDYLSAENPTDFTIKGVTFRNAICYEATCAELYEGSPKYMIAISNNAWFLPSIEPVLQKLLMKYYARKYGTLIFHSANMAGTGIITP